MYTIHYFSETGFVDSGLTHGDYYDTVEDAYEMARRALNEDMRIEKANIVDCDTLKIMEEL